MDLKNFSENLKVKASKIKVMAFDVDGVFTDGSLTFDQDGKEYKTFNAKDGQGIICVERAGIVTVIITARKNGTVEHRAKNLGITELHQGIKFKLPVLEQIVKERGLSMEEVSYMGDDLPDICILEKVGLACCPNDAVDEVKNICNFVSTKNGGCGAIRELCDFVLNSQGVEPLSIVRSAQKCN